MAMSVGDELISDCLDIAGVGGAWNLGSFAPAGAKKMGMHVFHGF